MRILLWSHSQSTTVHITFCNSIKYFPSQVFSISIFSISRQLRTGRLWCAFHNFLHKWTAPFSKQLASHHTGYFLGMESSIILYSESLEESLFELNCAWCFRWHVFTSIERTCPIFEEGKETCETSDVSCKTIRWNKCKWIRNTWIVFQLKLMGLNMKAVKRSGGKECSKSGSDICFVFICLRLLKMA